MKRLFQSTISHLGSLCLFSLVFFGSEWHVGDCARQLTLKVNPDCDIPECENNENRTNVNLVYVAARGEKDVFHYLWSTIGSPSILLVQTSPSAKLIVDWTRLLNESSADGSISFDETPEYFYSVTIANLWEFRDPDDTGRLDPSSNKTTRIDFDGFVWDDIRKSITNGSSYCSAKFVTTKNTSEWINADGLFSLEMESYSDEGRSDILPRLQHTINSTQVRIVLDNMAREFKESRYGLELLIATSSLNDTELKLSVDKTIDDEYTPGVFKTAQLSSQSGGFLYWKPVVYTSTDLVITNSTDTASYDVVQSNHSTLPYSIARAFLGLKTPAAIFGTSVTFGSTKDNFYEKTYYQVWTVMAGVGSIPQDTVSMMVIAVISAGLGLPLLVMAVGGIYLLVVKFRKQKDDLLLSQDGR